MKIFWALWVCIVLSSGSLAELPKGLGAGEQELRLYELNEEHNYIELRNLAHQLLEENPRSYPGLLGMGRFYHESETNLPRAYYYLKKARAAYEDSLGIEVWDHETWRWHLMILRELADVAHEMGRIEEQIEFINFCNELYNPDIIDELAWAQLKLKQYDELETTLEEGLKTVEPRTWAYWGILNTRGAVYSERDMRVEAYDAFHILTDELGGETGHVYAWRNQGEAALALLKFDEAERDHLRATQQGNDEDITSNPWKDLAYLYLVQGRYDEGFSALTSMVRWGLVRKPKLDQQVKAGEALVRAFFLVTAGYPLPALRISEFWMKQPDRLAFTSSEAEQTVAGLYILQYLTLKCQSRLKKEAWCWQSWWQRVRSIPERLLIWVNLSFLRRKIKALIFKHEYLAPSLRAYHPQSVYIPEYFKGILYEICGSGAVRAQLAGDLIHYEHRALIEGYLLGLTAIGDARAGEGKAAITQIDEALQKIPLEEKIFRSYLRFQQGIAAWQSSARQRAMEFYQEMMGVCPAFFRIDDLPLPVRLVADGTKLAQQVRSIMEDSPAIDEWEGGFILSIRGIDRDLRIQLLDPLGNEFWSFAPSDGSKTPQAIAQEIHARLFSSAVSFDEKDIYSLDGTNLKQEETRQQLRQFFFPDSSVH